jgi:hypothetical protein
MQLEEVLQALNALPQKDKEAAISQAVAANRAYRWNQAV